MKKVTPEEIIYKLTKQPDETIKVAKTNDNLKNIRTAKSRLYRMAGDLDLQYSTVREEYHIWRALK